MLSLSIKSQQDEALIVPKKCWCQGGCILTVASPEISVISLITHQASDLSGNLFSTLGSNLPVLISASSLLALASPQRSGLPLVPAGRGRSVAEPTNRGLATVSLHSSSLKLDLVEISLNLCKLQFKSELKPSECLSGLL